MACSTWDIRFSFRQMNELTWMPFSFLKSTGWFPFSFPRILRPQAGAFLLSAFHERYERTEVLRWNQHSPIYSHTLLKLPQDQKESVFGDLRLLNVTRETLWPSVDEAARAVTQQHLNRTD